MNENNPEKDKKERHRSRSLSKRLSRGLNQAISDAVNLLPERIKRNRVLEQFQTDPLAKQTQLYQHAIDEANKHQNDPQYVPNIKAMKKDIAKLNDAQMNSAFIDYSEMFNKLNNGLLPVFLRAFQNDPATPLVNVSKASIAFNQLSREEKIRVLDVVRPFHFAEQIRVNEFIHGQNIIEPVVPKSEPKAREIPQAKLGEIHIPKKYDVNIPKPIAIDIPVPDNPKKVIEQEVPDVEEIKLKADPDTDKFKQPKTRPQLKVQAKLGEVRTPTKYRVDIPKPISIDIPTPDTPKPDPSTQLHDYVNYFDLIRSLEKNLDVLQQNNKINENFMKKNNLMRTGLQHDLSTVKSEIKGMIRDLKQLKKISNMNETSAAVLLDDEARIRKVESYIKGIHKQLVNTNQEVGSIAEQAHNMSVYYKEENKEANKVRMKQGQPLLVGPQMRDVEKVKTFKTYEIQGHREQDYRLGKDSKYHLQSDTVHVNDPRMVKYDFRKVKVLDEDGNVKQKKPHIYRPSYYKGFAKRINKEFQRKQYGLASIPELESNSLQAQKQQLREQYQVLKKPENLLRMQIQEGEAKLSKGPTYGYDKAHAASARIKSESYLKKQASRMEKDKMQAKQFEAEEKAQKQKDKSKGARHNERAKLLAQHKEKLRKKLLAAHMTAPNVQEGTEMVSHSKLVVPIIEAPSKGKRK